MTNADALTNQYNRFQNTFDEINQMIADPQRGLKHPETMMAIKVGLQNMFNIRLPKVMDKGVNAYFISNLIAKGVNGGKGLEDPETRGNVMKKVGGIMTGIENALGLKQGTLTSFVESLFGEAKKELDENPEQTVTEARTAEETVKNENNGQENTPAEPISNDPEKPLTPVEQTAILNERAAFLKAQTEVIEAHTKLEAALKQATAAVAPIVNDVVPEAAPESPAAPASEMQAAGHKKEGGGQAIAGDGKRKLAKPKKSAATAPTSATGT